MQALSLNKTQREEGDKVNRQMRKLFERLETLERREEERNQVEEVRRQMEQVIQEGEDRYKQTKIHIDQQQL